MKSVVTLLRNIIVALLLMILLMNLYFIGARIIGSDSNPKLLGISYSIVLSGSMQPVFDPGDLLVYKQQEQYEVGDIVIFSQDSVFVTHRIIDKTADGFITKGDANNTADIMPVKAENIHGEMLFIIPNLGNVLLFLRQPLGIFILICTGLVLWELPNITKLLTKNF